MTESHPTGPTPSDTGERGPVEVDFHFLDREVCGRCRDTDANLDAALEVLQPVAELLGVGMTVRKTKIESVEQARELGFVSSPTIRIDGTDIAPRIEESACEPCGDLCGCGEDFHCRIWRWRGAAYREAPTGLIAEAVMQSLLGREDVVESDRREAVEPPLQLRQFFEYKRGAAPMSGVRCC